MPRLSYRSLLTLALLLLLSVACGGGGNDAGRIPIRRLDLEGRQLTYADTYDPSFAEPYPAVVADVAGVPVTGEDLASKQVTLELSRRQLVDQLVDLMTEEMFDTYLHDLEVTDPLEAVVDEELLRQAAVRMGFRPSYAEAVAAVRREQSDVRSWYAEASPEDRALMDDIGRRQGLAPGEWPTEEQLIVSYRKMRAVTTLKERLCETGIAPTPGLNFVSPLRECDEFLAEQRGHADIRYFVEWED